jgi:uncharacterized protein (TIGR02453 family)
MPRATPGRFEGFADPKFFRQLAKNQSRDWFKAHKHEYDEGFADPMLALLSEVASKLDRSYPDCELGEPKVFRIHRDVRFSKDKSPYKTHVAGVLSVRLGGSKVTETPAALYVHVGYDAASKKDQLMTGGGLYMMDSSQLAKYRAAALGDEKGRELARIVAAVRKRGASIEAGDTLKTLPRGVPAEHPRADLLKLKGLVAMYDGIPAKTLRSRELAGWLVERGKQVAPLVRWLTFATM